MSRFNVKGLLSGFLLDLRIKWADLEMNEQWAAVGSAGLLGFILGLLT